MFHVNLQYGNAFVRSTNTIDGAAFGLISFTHPGKSSGGTTIRVWPSSIPDDTSLTHWRTCSGVVFVLKLRESAMEAFHGGSMQPHSITNTQQRILLIPLVA